MLGALLWALDLLAVFGSEAFQVIMINNFVILNHHNSITKDDVVYVCMVIVFPFQLGPDEHHNYSQMVSAFRFNFLYGLLRMAGRIVPVQVRIVLTGQARRLSYSGGVDQMVFA